MSVQRQTSPPQDSELETTAELPVLDVAAYEAATGAEGASSTDTWQKPSLERQQSASSAGTAAQAEPIVVAAADDRSLQLETDLRALSENLRDVEERLTRKGERLIQLERELEEARAERVAVDERAARLVSEAEERAASAIREAREQSATLVAAAETRTSAATAELAAQLAARERDLAHARRDLEAVQLRTSSYIESLQSLEGRRNIFDRQLLDLDDELQARDEYCANLEKELTAGSLQARELMADLARRDERVEALEKEVASLAGALGERKEEAEQSGLATGRLQESVDTLAASLTAVKADLTARDEALVDAARAREALEAELGESRSSIESLERDLTAALAEATRRASNEVRLEGERNSQIERLAGAEARGLDLEERLGDNAEMIRQLQEELRNALNRSSELEGDLRAAEDAIHRLETELRSRSTRLEELTRTQEEWRGTIEDARHSLAERDSLIHRLQSEAANSAQLLGNIQQSIRRFDTGQSGSHEIAPEGAVRLLIRMDGDSEVVHVLGRKTTVGRTPDNDLQVDAKFISRNHAMILAGPHHTIIEDLNSTNGVCVNSKRIKRHTLQDGDIVAFGKTTYRFAVRPAMERR